MQPETSSSTDLIFGLDDRPKPLTAMLAAMQHVLASFVGIITPPLVIASALGLTAYLPYLISTALMVSGVGTFIQARRPLGIGAGMICLQGTSFSFLGAILSAGFMVKQRGGNPEDVLAMIFGLCFFGALVQIVLSRFIGQLRKVITPLVTGIVITLIGVSLINVGVTDLGGGFNAADFGEPINLGLGVFVLLVIVLLNRSNTAWVRLSAIILGLALGSIAAWFCGKLVPHSITSVAFINVPIPFKFGFSFDWTAFIPVALIYLISTIETVGDLTANCMLSRQPITGPSYIARLKGGVLGDGVSCLIAATLGAFPNTTFAQNNGVIQLTGVASRYIGLYIGVLLFVLGLFPMIGALLQQIPKPVLGGATLVMFGSVAAAGVRILSQAPLDRRSMLIIAVSFGVGMGIAAQPTLLSHLPKLLQTLFDSPITSGGITAIVMCLLLPERATTDQTSESGAETDALEQ